MIIITILNLTVGILKESGPIWIRYTTIILYFYRLLIKIIDFYFPLFVYSLMTSAGGNVT